jgi:hypothetical protein
VTRAVTARVGLAGYTTASFTAAAQASFISGVAARLSVSAASVKITTIADYTVGGGAGRRLLATGVEVGFSVDAEDAPTATTLATSLATLTSNQTTFTAALQAAGLTSLTGTEVTAAPAVVVVEEIAISSAAPGAAAASLSLVALTIVTGALILAAMC